MLDFEKLDVYQKSKTLYTLVEENILIRDNIDKIVKDQLKRATLSITLNIAEGCSRYSKADRKKFFIIARGSAFESAAIFDIFKNTKRIENEIIDDLLYKAEEISKMLFALIRNLQ